MLPMGNIAINERQTRPLTRLRERWDMSRPRAYQLIESSDAMDVVSTIVDIQPTNWDGFDISKFFKK